MGLITKTAEMEAETEVETEAATTEEAEVEITMGQTTDLHTALKTTTRTITMEAAAVRGTATIILLHLLPFLRDGNLHLQDLAMDLPHHLQATTLTAKDLQDHLGIRKVEEGMVTGEAAAVIEDKTHIGVVVILTVVDVKGVFKKRAESGRADMEH